jgi:pantoate--beta-alanine ligase
VITAWTVADVRAAVGALRRDAHSGGGVGLVPTMGALHAGHLALVAAARRENAAVVASIFVNPAQFGPDEDLDRYPRDLPRDARVAEESGVDVLFVPSADELYPPGFQTWVDVEELARGLEGDARPGHFRGVATICLKLFNVVRPDRAYFGQKDAQQAAVVERMARDLHLETEIRVVATVRDEDGVALSSRNAYLAPEEREAARAIHRALTAGESAHRQGAHADAVARTVLAGDRRLVPEYVEVARLDGRLVLAIAARAGDTRLIDNVVLEGDPGT